MAQQLYYVGIRWIKTPVDVDKVDGLLSANGDWYRLNAYTWFSFTPLNQDGLYKLLRPHLQSDDSLVIIKTDPSAYNGWAPKQFWDWIEQKKAIMGRGG
jgi:hypothetical protein